MMRPPETGGGTGKDIGDLDDAEIEPKRGAPDQLPDSPSDVAGQDPAEGRSDLGFPGADRDADRPEQLGERLENGSSSTMAIDSPDSLPDVEPPETTM